jgi:hypothetical protein
VTGKHHLNPPRWSRERQQGWTLGITIVLTLLAIIFGSVAVWVAAFIGAMVFAILVR